MTSKKAVSCVRIWKMRLNKSFLSQGTHTSIELLQRRRSRKARSSRCTRIWFSWKGWVGRTLRRIYWNPRTVCIPQLTLLHLTKRYFSFFFSIRLKRIYILFTAKHGLNAFDRQMLSHLSQKLVTARGTQPFTLQAIITKADLVTTDDLATNISLMQKDIWESAPLCLPAIVTSTAMSPPFQIDLVQKNIADVCGL